MSKEECIQDLTDINSSFVNDINTKLSNLELQQCKKFNYHLLTRIIQLERNVVTNSQYSRRETIELNLVPADITEDVLEENICKALTYTLVIE